MVLDYIIACYFSAQTVEGQVRREGISFKTMTSPTTKKQALPITAYTRLQKDFARLMADPVPYIIATPKAENILEWLDDCISLSFIRTGTALAWLEKPGSVGVGERDRVNPIMRV